MPTAREIKQRQAVIEKLVRLGLIVRITHDPKKNLEQERAKLSTKRKIAEKKLLEEVGHPSESVLHPLKKTKLPGKIFKKEINALKKAVAKPTDWIKVWGAWPKRF